MCPLPPPGIVAKRLASPAALSGFLGAVDAEEVYAAQSGLLLDIPDVWELLEEPAVATYDTHGRPYALLDYDPTVERKHERDLAPADAERPAPKRRATELMAGGYAGRHRADAVYNRAVMFHTGAGIWLFNKLGVGNGSSLASGLSLEVGSR